MTQANFSPYIPYHPSRVKLGIDRFAENPKSFVGEERVALLCHAASVDQSYTHLTQIASAAQLNVVRCFGPEHGIWADAQDMEAVEEEGIEPNTGAPVSSMYGKTVDKLTPHASLLHDVETLIIDLQDVGSRYYTYIYTATLCAKVCAQTGTRVLILDRPNPLGGIDIEGGMTHRDYSSFVGMWPLPNRHGMTLGEVVSLLNTREGFNADIEVIEVQGWTRDQLLYQTGQRWVLPSPNMRSFEAMMVYPGMCLIEGTEMSEARGTTKPFEWVGAGYIDPFKWAQALNHLDLPGICFRPLYYKPTFHKWAHQTIGGVELHLTNPHTLQPLRVGLHLLSVTRQMYGDALLWRKEAYEYVEDKPAIDLLLGGAQGREVIDSGGDIDALWMEWNAQSEGFREERMPYLRYS